MFAHRYVVWPNGWGDVIDPDESINEKRLVGITALAKRDPLSPFEVFNEVLAMNLGQIIGLPIPAGIVVEREKNPFFASCLMKEFNGGLPPANFPRLCADRPDEVCGIVLFDAWIANGDRHNNNIWYDYYGHHLAAFDHGMAILGTGGSLTLRSKCDRLGILEDSRSMVRHITTFASFPKWLARIQAIDAGVIENLAISASSVGVNRKLADECAEWLINRRLILPKLFQDSKHIFSKLTDTLFDPFGLPDDYFPDYCI